MRTPLALSLVAIAAGALGFALGRTTAPRSGDEEVLRALERQGAQLDLLPMRVLAAAQQGRAAVAPGPGQPDGTWLRAEISRAVREAMAGAPPAAEEAEPSKPEAPPPTPANLQAFQGAEQLIEDATRAGSWGDAQADELRRLMPQMNDTQRDAALRRLSVSINRGDFKVVTRGAPF